MIKFLKSMGSGQEWAHSPWIIDLQLNIILVSSAEVEVEIFLSNRVKPLHELQSFLDSLCLLPS